MEDRSAREPLRRTSPISWQSLRPSSNTAATRTLQLQRFCMIASRIRVAVLGWRMSAIVSVSAWPELSRPALIASPTPQPGSVRRTGTSEKEAYIAHLRKADKDILRVSLADKVHNARAILRDLRKPEVGDTIWSRFSQPKEHTLWYYCSLANSFRELLPGQLADELHEIVELLKAGA
jgi:hypothetical protein